ncbi:hypothetical protein [Streptomyces sp. NPDC058657]|uniref:hypothetical protein n=1 Tax=unclassified Streptomyces TaxID=2593676 RepID=UPI003662B4F5
MSGSWRLLPWTGDGGKPCYVHTDAAAGPASRVADTVESIQLGMAGDLLRHAEDMLVQRRVTRGELHFLAGRLSESLRDVLRIAESRGARLGETPPPPRGDAGP